MQNHAPHACVALYKPAGQKKGVEGTKADIKKLLFLAAAVVSGEC